MAPLTRDHVSKALRASVGESELDPSWKSRSAAPTTSTETQAMDDHDTWARLMVASSPRRGIRSGRCSADSSAMSEDELLVPG